jgi:hypothetical protein
MIRPWPGWIVVAACLATAVPARAWGPAAHRIVARLAADRLEPAAERGVARLLDDRTLADVATWADDVRDARPESARWHYVDIPVGRHEYRPSRDCRPESHGDCAIAAIARFRAVLADAHAGVQKRREALEFLVHLVADVHQPLHCADDGDRGGNEVDVWLRRRPTNLHAVWDSGLVTEAGLDEAAYARRLDDWLAHQDVTRLAGGTVADWALESHDAAVEHAYVLPANRRLGVAYVRANLPVVDRQLALASVRLARVLNEAFHD